MKKKVLLSLVLVGIGSLIYGASNIFTDFLSISGNGSLRNTSIFWIDANRDVSVYDGDVILGGSGSTPSTTAGTYPGVQVPFYNASATTLVQGNVIIASATNATAGAGYGSIAAVLSTTNVVGICAGTVASGAVGWMTVSGYALVLTTGTVNMGNVLVSTAGTVGTGAAGYAGAIVAPTSGTDIGIAMSQGTAAGGLTLVRLR
jgi:hypothetical protein